MIVLKGFGFSTLTAFTDSLVSNILLAGSVMLISNLFGYYLPAKQRYIYVLSLCLLMSAIWLFISRSLVMLVSPVTTDYQSFFSASIPVRMMIGFLVTGCMALLSVLWYTVQDQRENEKRKTDAEKLAREAELFKLRQQLHPHFLFNSLNSVNALIGSDPGQARNMIQQLSDFLRGTLKKEDNQWVSLDEELQHLKLYLDIEKVRFGHRLDSVINNEAPAISQLPAMLLQPIVENAIKFGLYDTTGDILIHINAAVENNMLRIIVQNPYDAETSSPGKGTGFGLKSVQRRLYLLFGRNDLLQTKSSDGIFITTILIPQLV
ncbi:MAG: hypothetical protein JWN76_758 [Chitinophagaceae bacterium]|nr:hypothetical protein [Chitinophagaceae bacterium]